MKHRIAAGVLIEQEGRILLVRHRKPGCYDFWVAPGGGAEGNEDLRNAARREVREECGLDVEPLAIAYIEELLMGDCRECKVWFTGRLLGGQLQTSSAAAAEHITDAAFLSRVELAGKTVYPTVLLDDYWQKREQGFAHPRYLGMRDTLLASAPEVA
jgi:8-oxo-dGTP diphosphatase